MSQRSAIKASSSRPYAWSARLPRLTVSALTSAILTNRVSVGVQVGLKPAARLAEYSGERTGRTATKLRPLNGKDEAMLRFLCSRCLRLWDAAAVAHRGTCPFCGGALDDNPR